MGELTALSGPLAGWEELAVYSTRTPNPHPGASVPWVSHFAAPLFTTDWRLFTTVWVKKIPPTVFGNFFPNGWEFLINFLHTYYTIISTLDYKFLFKYLQLWQSYAILSATTYRILHFTRTLTSKFAYWANDVIVDVMSFPTFVDIIKVFIL